VVSQKVERDKAVNPPAPGPTAVDRRREQEEALRDMAVETALQQVDALLMHENPVGNDEHFRGFQVLERAIQCLPSQLTAGVAAKWEQLAVELVRNQITPKYSAWNKREKIRALYREVAQLSKRRG